MFSTEIQVPSNKAGRVVGKGGKNVKRLGTETNTVIRVGTNTHDTGGGAGQSVSVIISGATMATCQAAASKLLALVQGKKPAVYTLTRAQKHSRKFTPAICSLCNTALNSLKTCITHVASRRHVELAGGVCVCGDKCTPGESIIASMLACSAQRSNLAKLGFDVEAIADALVDGGTVSTVDGAAKASKEIAADADWLVEQSIRYVSWNGLSDKGGTTFPLTQAAPLEQSLRRVAINQTPPLFEAPANMPVLLPPRKPRYTKERWPESAGAIPVAVAATVKAGESIDDVDIICGTSFIRAMCGQSRDTSHKYYLQRRGETLLVQKNPNRKTNDMTDPGVLVEDCCCKTAPHMTYFSVSRFKVGQYVLMTAAEVDGFSKETNRPVELKTKNKASQPSQRDLLQISINGSSHIAQFILSKDEKQLESLKMYSIDEIRKNKAEYWIFAGQRLKYVLGLILNNEAVKGAIERPITLSFGNDKLPVFSPAPDGTAVVPPGAA
jgi:hypothetical protein